jgi:hypothetical protein
MWKGFNSLHSNSSAQSQVTSLFDSNMACHSKTGAIWCQLNLRRPLLPELRVWAPGQLLFKHRISSFYGCLSMFVPLMTCFPEKSCPAPVLDHSEHWTCAHSAAVGQNKTRNISSLLQNSDLKKTMMSFNWKAGFRFLREKEMMKSIDRLRISGIVQCLLKPHNSIG